MAIRLIALVFKQIPKRAILNRKAKLALPHLACLKIGQICDEGVICLARGELRDAEVVLDEVVVVDEGLSVLNFAQLERFKGMGGVCVCVCVCFWPPVMTRLL
jgi:hypothetical protein